MNFKIDLKSIDLKNISLDDIQAKLKNVEKKTWIKLGTVVGAVVFFLIIFYGVLNPIVNKKKAQLDDMNLKIQETEGFNNSILVAKKKIKKIPYQKMRSVSERALKYRKIGRLFGDTCTERAWSKRSFLWSYRYHLASQKNPGCFFSSSRVTNLCSPLAISCRSNDFC